MLFNPTSKTILFVCTPPILITLNQFLPTVPTFAVRETLVSRTANVGTVGKNGLKRGKIVFRAAMLHIQF